MFFIGYIWSLLEIECRNQRRVGHVADPACVKLNKLEHKCFLGGCLMNLEEFTKETLWRMLVDTVHASVMYPSHTAYVRDVMLREKSDLTPTELANRLNMPLGEALVILDELAEDRKGSP